MNEHSESIPDEKISAWVGEFDELDKKINDAIDALDRLRARRRALVVEMRTAGMMNIRIAELLKVNSTWISGQLRNKFNYGERTKLRGMSDSGIEHTGGYRLRRGSNGRVIREFKK